PRMSFDNITIFLIIHHFMNYLKKSSLPPSKGCMTNHPPVPPSLKKRQIKTSRRNIQRSCEETDRKL
ncbi:MAG TPA: hypothetical protein P5107_11735, partial [Thermotogota bacterium]|nr:hypothetical protein [Thermotogota bacterium]